MRLKILYLSQRFGFKTSGIYADLINGLIKAGHEVSIAMCTDNPQINCRIVHSENRCEIIYSYLPNLFSDNKLKKGIAQLKVPYKLKSGVLSLYASSEFDLILYPTPPVTFAYLVKSLKSKYNARSYLMLKDIFPQNAVDLGLMRKGGFIYRYFRFMEKKLYKYSDIIGCMTPRNIEYITNANPFINSDKIELFPNTLIYKEIDLVNESNFNSETYKTFVFGGNLGIPQDIPFLLKCIKKLEGYKKARFLIIGDGYYSVFLDKYIAEEKPVNLKYFHSMSRQEYEKHLEKCDVGIVLLNYKFTIPNFPARILSYMSNGKPILAATDIHTDVGEIIETKAQCGKWCPSNCVDEFCELVKFFSETANLSKMGDNGLKYFIKNYQVYNSISILESKFK